jgi:hypothetical protein
MNAVLPWVQSKVNAATQEPRLETGFAIARDDLALFGEPLPLQIFSITPTCVCGI